MRSFKFSLQVHQMVIIAFHSVVVHVIVIISTQVSVVTKILPSLAIQIEWFKGGGGSIILPKMV